MTIKTKIITGFAVSFCTTALAVSGASGTTINDDYVGGLYYSGATHDYPVDVIGDADEYSVSHMNVNSVGSELVIDIHSRYYDNIGAGGTQLGDLFLSTDGWNPNNPTSSDTSINGNGEDWEYVFTIDDHLATSGNLSLFAIDDANIKYSDEQELGVYRNGQEVMYDGSNQSIISTGTWEIFYGDAGDADDFLRFKFNYADLGSVADTLGIRWTMTCANDIIEGGYSNPVPEPSTVLLFGAGLATLVGIRRKKNRK